MGGKSCPFHNLYALPIGYIDPVTASLFFIEEAPREKEIKKTPRI